MPQGPTGSETGYPSPLAETANAITASVGNAEDAADNATRTAQSPAGDEAFAWVIKGQNMPQENLNREHTHC